MRSTDRAPEPDDPAVGGRGPQAAPPETARSFEEDVPGPAGAAPARGGARGGSDRRPGPLRLLVVDDHAVVREGIVTLLQQGGFEIVGEAADGLEAISEAARLRPDVLVMDVNMPLMDGIEATRRIRQAHPEIRVVGLTLHDEETVRAMVEAGAEACLMKDAPVANLIRTLAALSIAA